MEPTLLTVKSRCDNSRPITDSLMFVKTKLDDGSTEKYYTDLSGNKQGYYIKRYKNGKIAAKINFQNNVYHGECISFFPDGSIEYKANYVTGRRHGHFRQWDKHGKLIHHLIYKNGTVMDIPYSIAKKIPLNKIYKTYDD